MKGRPAAECQSLQQRVAAQSVRPVQSRATRFTHRVQTLQACPPILICIHSADHVMGGWMNRNEILAHIDLELIGQQRQGRKPLAELRRREMSNIQENMRE